MFTPPSTHSPPWRNVVCNLRMAKKTPHEIDLGPIERVLALADKAGLIDAELCRRMGVQQQYLNNWRKRGLPAARHARAAEVFGVSIDYIAKGEGEENPLLDRASPLPEIESRPRGGPAVEGTTMRDKREKIMKMIDKLDEPNQQRLIGVIHGLLMAAEDDDADEVQAEVIRPGKTAAG